MPKRKEICRNWKKVLDKWKFLRYTKQVVCSKASNEHIEKDLKSSKKVLDKSNEM